MPIDKISAAQFRTQIRQGITERTETHDVAFGPIRDVVIDPMATVLEDQNDRIRQVSLLVSLVNSTEFSDDDLDALVFNEGLTRQAGSRATGTVVFSTVTVDITGPDLVVQRGFPIATLPDASTGTSITFVTTEERTLTAVNASSYFNIDTDRYELQVPVIATVEGSAGLVGASRINRPLRPLNSFDEVSNTTATTGGRDRETNAELIDRYLLAVLGRDLTTPTGVRRFALDNFPDTVDVLTVFGSNPLLTRTDTNAGAVDAYVLGSSTVTRRENLTYLGVNQLMTVSFPPLVSVTSVVEGATTFIEGTDYEVVFDDSDLAGSTRATEGVRFLAAGTQPSAPGAAVTVTYTSNQLIRNLQTEFELDNVFVFGRDLLIKEGLQVDIILEADLRVSSGFSTSTVSSAVNTAVLDFINALNLGDDVEESDIQGAVRRVSGVDNFIITRLVRSATDTGATDVLIADNEYARIAQADLVITLI